MDDVNSIEDEFHVKLTEPVDLEELRKPDSKGSEFEVLLPEAPKEKQYFDEEEVFKHLNYEANNIGGNDSGDDSQTPFEVIAKGMFSVISDGGVKKRVKKVGSGEVFQEGWTATIHYEGYFEYCDVPYDSSKLRNKPQKITLGEGQVIPGLEIAVSTMRKGEKSDFLVSPEYAFGPRGVPPRIPENATILFVIELLAISETPIAPDMDTWTAEKRKAATFDEILEVANAERKAGNEAYEEKRTSKATSHYIKAIRLLENARLANQSEEDEMRRVLLKLYLNMSICYIKQGHYTRALSNCTKALEIDPDNIKALFRRGQALLRSGEFDQARHWLSKAQKISPKNSAIEAELRQLGKVKAKFEQLDKMMYSRMFASANTTNKDVDKQVKANDTKTKDKQKKCPPEAQELLRTKLKAFVEDAVLMEMPFALDTLTPAETEYLEQAALEMGLQVRTLHQNSEKYLKIFKPNPEAAE
ncbi:inactive peptidyl-prolyl cis-trans isomerase FKBP6-like isoform X2 [Acanthaster planci]|nr:inactive peptidyl-prolyl cis-trans isomerase FKBP6-like isoform X2 [Acanthaster planci]XP_022108901.1 inactive peptidyl-prolyl cis-trans isomerase FKBP6-like isoform X2 [Acanthaster planci]XP_022108902.1 inactive peptidyl-prolyl cis-trans isomerase FKBP6-like isoform X2 [Acanthaster planci]XP_022108903.1 inactive peptidyl-prolyl cis-trans isomerase FKBP6-like isoform X2 [Acanthaster planci]